MHAFGEGILVGKAIPLPKTWEPRWNLCSTEVVHVFPSVRSATHKVQRSRRPGGRHPRRQHYAGTTPRLKSNPPTQMEAPQFCRGPRALDRLASGPDACVGAEQLHASPVGAG